MTYGGVSANTNSSQTQYFNNVSPILATAYYCDEPNITPDHLITIVGWDDNYSKENFNAAHRPTKMVHGLYLIHMEQALMVVITIYHMKIQW